MQAGICFAEGAIFQDVNPRLIHKLGFRCSVRGYCENRKACQEHECVVCHANLNHRLDLQNDFDHVVLNHLPVRWRACETHVGSEQ